MSIGAMTGSFDIFHNGHLAILKEAVDLFDKVYIVIANNPNKKERRFPEAFMKKVIESVLKKENLSYKVEVVIEHNLICDFLIKHNVTHIIRGLRDGSVGDYEYQIALVNKELCPNIHTILLGLGLPYISSTMLWELYTNYKDISKYIPYELPEYCSHEYYTIKDKYKFI